jgi:hypothetical protein
VAVRPTFEIATAKDYPGKFDLICFFDCLHDMGDPVVIARYARDRLEPTAPRCWWSHSPSTGRAANIAENLMAALLYTASSAIARPTRCHKRSASALALRAEGSA